MDLLQNRWGSLSGFQRTRGALRLLGHTVKALCLRNSHAPLIHVGDVANGAAPAPNGGSQCDIGPSAPQTLPIATNLTWYPANGRFTLLLDGHVAPGSRITKIVLDSNGKARELPLAKAYFLADLAVAPQGRLPADGRPYALIGYDKEGQEVSRVDLQRLAGSAGP